MTTTEHRPRSPLAEPDFRRLFTAAAASRLGTAVTTVAIPLTAVLALHAGPGQVGALAALGTAAFLLVGLPAGAWVDRLPHRATMVAADLCRAALLAWVPVAAAFGVLGLPQLYAVVLLAGVATVFFEAASVALLPTLLPTGQLVGGNAWLVTVDAAGMIGGRGLAGYLVQLVGAPVALAVDAASYVWSAAWLARVRPPRPTPQTGPRPGMRREVAAGLRLVWHHPLRRPLAIKGALANLASQLVLTILPVLLVDTLRLPAAVFGAFLSVGGLGVLVGARTARPLARRYGTGRVLALLGLPIAPFSLLVAAAGSRPLVWLAAVGWLLTTYRIGVDNVLGVSLRQHVTPAGMLGRVNATMRFLLTGSLTLGAALAGVLGAWAGVRVALTVGAAGLATAVLPLTFSAVRTAHMPWDAPTHRG